jgi:5'-3' exonuclease
MGCDWLLVDGSSLIFRAYYGVKDTTRAGGIQVNAIRGFLDRLGRLITERRPVHVAVADDSAWRPRWRVEQIPSYKSHRVAEPVPAALEPQIPVIHDILGSIGIDVDGVAEHEAEDVIASLCALVTGTVEVASGDRDLFALVEGQRVRILYPEKSGLSVIDEDEVARRYGIPGRRYADFAILRGDPSDGLPGLKGVGNVAAAAMVRRYGDIAGILRERRLRDADREYLENALAVVPPVADLPIALPPGRRDSYPVDAAELDALASRYRVAASCRRLVAAMERLATRPARPSRPSHPRGERPSERPEREGGSTGH